MKTLNIRAFKFVLFDGVFGFELKNRDDQGSCGSSSIRNLAKQVKREVAAFFSENTNDLSRVFIDLRPYHDIECPSGLAPRRCLPLNEVETKVFWKHFNEE